MKASPKITGTQSVLLSGAVIAPIAAFSVSLTQAAAVSFAFFCITFLTVLAGSLIPVKLPLSLRILLYSVIGCLVYIPVAVLTVNLFPSVSGGIYIPLLSSALYLTAGFQRYFRRKHLFRDLLKNLLSVICTAMLTGCIREVLGSGTVAGIPLRFQPPLPILVHPSGGLILLVLILTAVSYLRGKEAAHADCG